MKSLSLCLNTNINKDIEQAAKFTIICNNQTLNYKNKDNQDFLACKVIRNMTNKGIAFFLAIFCLIAGGCAQRAEKLEIEMKVPEVIAGGQYADGEAELLNRWWLSFDNEQLNKLIDTALQDNLTLLQMWQRVEQAKLAAEIAGAELYPSVDIKAGASRNRTQSQTGNTNYNSLYSTSLVVNYELDIWKRAEAQAAAGAYLWQASSQDYQAARISIASQIAMAWFAIMEARQRLEIIDSQIQINSDTLDIITQRFRRGQAEAVDVLQQRQLLESGKGQKLPVMAQLETYKTQLAILIGNSADEIALRQEAVLPDVESLPLSVQTADLIQRRPDIQSAYLKVKAQDEKIAQALANKLPRLSLSATLGTSDNQLKNLFDSFQSSIAGDIVMPLFDANSRELQAQRQYSLRLEASYAYVQSVHDAVKEVRDALVLEKNQALYIQSLEKQLELSKQSVERVRQNYAKGRTDFLRLLSVQSSDRQLELSYIAAKNDLLTYRINLYKALAGEIEG